MPRTPAKDPAISMAMLEALESGETEISPQAFAALADLLAHERKALRRRASGVLAGAARAGHYRQRLEALLADENPQRRWGAAFALSQASETSERTIDAAIEAMGCDDGDVRWAAAEIVCNAYRDAQRCGAQRAAALAGRLEELVRGAQGEQRKMALYCLRDLDAVAVPAALDALEDAEKGVRLAALSALARARASAPAVLERMAELAAGDPDQGVRNAASATLGRLREKEQEG
jgi:HEAT repeat protein